MTQKKICKLISLISAIALVLTSVFTGGILTATAEDTNTITVSPDVVVLGASTPITITISGGLEANKSYVLRIYKSWSENNMGAHNFTGSGVNFGSRAGTGQASFTTDANGGATITATMHSSSVTAYGTYAYTVMDASDNYSTKAAAFFTVTSEQAVIASHAEIQVGVSTDYTITVTGLIPKKSYNVRVCPASNSAYTAGSNGFGDGGGTWENWVTQTSASVDESTATLTKTMTFNISTAGTYCVAIQDGWSTKAHAFFKVGDSTVEIKAKSISATPNALEAGVATDVTLNVTGLSLSTKYLVRLYTANSGYSSENDGFGSDGIVFDNNYTQYTDITTDGGGSANATYSINVAKSGTYALCVMTTSYDTLARAFIKVTSDEYLKKTVYAESENLEIDVLWDNITDTVGWAAIYPKGYTDMYTYGDYIYKGDASFPSGDTSRYKAFSWSPAAGEYTIVFYEGSGYTVYKSIDIEIVHYDVTLTPDTFEIGGSEAMTLSVEGGLDAGKSYAIRVYKASGTTSGFGNSGIDWNGNLGEYGKVTADDNGSITVTANTHTTISTAGTYAYTVMDVSDSYNTVARAFFTVTEPEEAVMYDLQSYAGDIVVTNDTTADTLLADLQALTIDEGHTVESINNFYIYKAIEGVIEEGSTYEGAENYNGKVLVPGVDGSVSATVNINSPDGAKTAVVTFIITAPMATRGYASMSNPEPDPSKNPDWSWASYNARWEYHPESGYAAEKILIPNEITEMKNDWHYAWNGDGYATIKCVVFPENLEVIPVGNGLSNVEVVSFAGNKITSTATYTDQYGNVSGALEGYTSLKYIRLPDSMTSIGDRAFAGCSSLTTLYIPDGVTSIGNMAFYAHTEPDWSKRKFHYMEEITIPASVTSIGTYAFYYPLKNDTTSDNFTITYLNPNITGGFIGYDSGGKFITMRAENTSASGDAYDGFNCDSRFQAKEDLGSMSIAEVAARVARKANMLKDTTFTDTATVTQLLSNAYGNVSSVSISFKNEKWEAADGMQTNTVVITKGGVTAEIEISLAGKTSFYADGASILTTEAFTANGNKQGLRFYNGFESSSADKVIVKGYEYDIVEFGVVLKHVGTDATSAKNNTVADTDFIIGAEGITQIVGKENTIQSSDGVNFYTVYIKNIPQGGRNYSFQCRGYIKYQDGDTVKTVYTDSQVKSINDVFSANSTASEYSGMADWFAGN